MQRNRPSRGMFQNCSNAITRGSARNPMRRACCAIEHYNNVHPHSALGYLSPREFRKQMMENTTGNAVGAVRRPHDSPISADVIGSRPKPQEAVARTARRFGLE